MGASLGITAQFTNPGSLSADWNEGLGATDSQIEWVIAAYILAFALGLLPFGRLGDILGRTHLFLWGVAAFTAASALCGLAPNIEDLIAARLVQGLAGAQVAYGPPAETLTNAVLEAMAHPDFQTELGQFNIEVNLAPATLHERGLSRLEEDLRRALNDAEQKANEVGAHQVMIGILPTLAEGHMSVSSLSPNPRYKLLSEQILSARGEDISINIEGCRLEDDGTCFWIEGNLGKNWSELDLVPHRFNLGRYPRGESRSEVFRKPGVVRLFCDIHSEMSAVILRATRVKNSWLESLRAPSVRTLGSPLTSSIPYTLDADFLRRAEAMIGGNGAGGAGRPAGEQAEDVDAAADTRIDGVRDVVGNHDVTRRGDRNASAQHAADGDVASNIDDALERCIELATERE